MHRTIFETNNSETLHELMKLFLEVYNRHFAKTKQTNRTKQTENKQNQKLMDDYRCILI